MRPAVTPSMRHSPIMTDTAMSVPMLVVRKGLYDCWGAARHRPACWANSVEVHAGAMHRQLSRAVLQSRLMRDACRFTDRA